MKFEKFVKSLASNGVIYKKGEDERWLASSSVFMRIPDTIRSVTASDILPMPEGVDKLIDADLSSDPCELYKAVMPCANAGIKDCIRIFATENALCKIAVRNNDYALIERGDIVEIYSKYNTETEQYEAKALMIKAYPVLVSDEPELIGMVFPVDCEEV